MTFDLTINIGNIITIITIAASIGALFIMMKYDLREVKQRLDKVEIVMGKVTDALVQLAVQEVRLDGHDKRLDRLEVKD